MRQYILVIQKCQLQAFLVSSFLQLIETGNKFDLASSNFPYLEYARMLPTLTTPFTV